MPASFSSMYVESEQNSLGNPCDSLTSENALVDMTLVELAGFHGQVEQGRNHLLGIGLFFRRGGGSQFGLGSLDLRGEVGMVEFGKRRRLFGQDGQAFRRDI